MTSDETKRKLREMRLNAMVEILEVQEQQPEYQQMDFEDKFELIVDGAYARQQSNKLSRLLHSADFPSIEPALAEIDYLPDRKLDRKLIQKLATGNYIREHHNIILMGASGNGKTWLANALGIEACRQFYKVKYVRLPELLDDLAVAKHEANGNFHKILARYKKVDVLIIDEWLLTELSLEQSTYVLELVESRLHQSSTIYCSQFAPDGWHNKLGNPQIADAILDRIIHDAYPILIQGDKSMLERYGLRGDSV